MKYIIIITTLLFAISGYAQQDSTQVYKKRVLETTEIDFIASYYQQDGNNAAVSGGIGSEELTDAVSNIIVSMPLNDDDVLSFDLGISAYTSASSGNVDPFDSNQTASPFNASSGASESDLWGNLTTSYSHSSDDRNKLWSGKLSVSTEFDYFSIGLGGSYTRLFNEKNTEISLNGNVFIDTWNAIYPRELRPFSENGAGLNDYLFTSNTITGNVNYKPIFSEYKDESRNSYALGISVSQILSKKLQASFLVDLVQQKGLLSTPFQRVYFADKANSFIQDFQLADAIEKLPGSRFKVALGSRFNYYINEAVVLRTFYRYYFDDWGIASQTASVELPIKIAQKFTLYPSYRYYNQTEANYFAPYEQNLSSDQYYTSDYDLSKYNANQLGFGVSYIDIFTKFHILKFGLKKVDFKYNHYKRNTGLVANNFALGFTFVGD